MDKKQHWQYVYENKSAQEVSWFQAHATTSLKLIEQANTSKGSAIVDIGGGASTLVDDLLVAGYKNISVFDLSSSALNVSKKRLGALAENIQWQVGDITQVDFPTNSIDLWHDRAVFHFLINDADRNKYLSTLKNALKVNGYVIFATFAKDGPEKCSGLPVQRYTSKELSLLCGNDFKLVNEHFQVHKTPFESSQNFVYCLFKRMK